MKLNRILPANNVKIPLGIIMLLFSCLINVSSQAQIATVTPPKQDTTKIDSNKTKVDSSSVNKITKDTLHMSKDSLDAPVKYEAKDSGVMNLNTNEFILYGKSNVAYKDVKLIAATINYNSQKQLVKAFGATDTTNNPMNRPTLSQAGAISISDTIAFNMKNMKGLTKNTYYNEGEIYVNAERLKKVDKDVFYAYHGRFTTCNLDTPHFAIRTRKMKMISNKMAFTGPAFPEFEGVPLPIGLPFGIFPLIKGRHSGLIAPQFVTSQDFGIGLEGLGFYKVLSENADVTFRTNFYSYGGWSINMNPKYLKRYRYMGSLNITVQHTTTLNNYASSEQEFTTIKSYSIQWNHSRDNKAHPGTTFSANVNFSSTKYNQTVLNNPFVNFQNQISSTISYTKDWKGVANMSVNASHNQNNVTKLVYLSLPNISLNVPTKYPFQQKEKVGKAKWYENIGIGYSANLQNQIAFYDTAFSLKKAMDTVQWGVTHNVPISIALPSLGPITFSPSVSYRENWLAQSITRTWDPNYRNPYDTSIYGKMDTSVSKGIFASREVAFGIGVSTRVFGNYTFPHSKKIVAIRHEMRPSIGFSYRPDLNAQNHYSVVFTDKNKVQRSIRFSKFDGVVPGGFAEGLSGSVSFGVDNLLEMKVKKASDTGNVTKKIKLLEGFGFNGSYNLLADSFQLSKISLYARTNLFEKVSITASAMLDPYKTDKYGYSLKQYAWQGNGFSLGRITSGNIALSTQFKSKPKDGKTDKDRVTKDPFMTTDEQMRQLQFTKGNPGEYTDFNIPWSVSMSYSLTYARNFKSDYSGLETVIYSGFNFNGDFSLTPRWKVGATGYYDVTNKRLNQLSTFVSREMHCWQLSISLNPVGIYHSFSIVISPKSGILRDLKINRSRTFSNY